VPGAGDVLHGGPLHLLLLDEPPADYLVDEGGKDPDTAFDDMTTNLVKVVFEEASLR
jgi:hypothetical protein